MSLSKEEKLSHLFDLMNMAKADDAIQKIESVYIYKVAERMGIDQLELVKLETLGVEKRSFPKTEHQIIPLFHRLLILMCIDASIDDLEISFCKDLGLKMGLNPFAVNEIVTLACQKQPEHLSPDEINTIFRRFYN
ncbi:hypothetical protein [Fulvivirga sediminis]|uniref:TerB family tellurite resistance protein n=1 Tax=Fulvivirga sediminis TaxID=2803949 RepID=A0A937K327_9BACT|nr:hypothetical protein [Fulvivirga sediminis]MBL3658512.1 hypothetical protein [Fulvivirga sediminis]